jgi:hypothetical protein
LYAISRPYKDFFAQPKVGLGVTVVTELLTSMGDLVATAHSLYIQVFSKMI